MQTYCVESSEGAYGCFLRITTPKLDACSFEGRHYCNCGKPWYTISPGIHKVRMAAKNSSQLLLQRATCVDILFILCAETIWNSLRLHGMRFPSPPALSHQMLLPSWIDAHLADIQSIIRLCTMAVAVVKDPECFQPSALVYFSSAILTTIFIYLMNLSDFQYPSLASQYSKYTLLCTQMVGSFTYVLSYSP